MALRSLSGKLNGFLRARAAAAASSSPTAAATAASSMIPVKCYSTEARHQAIIRERRRLQEEKMRRGYKFLGVFVAACYGAIAFAWSSTRKSIEERKRKHMVFQEKMDAIIAMMGDDYEPICSIEDVFAYLMDEQHSDMMDIKRRVSGGNVMDAKEKSKSVDA